MISHFFTRPLPTLPNISTVLFLMLIVPIQFLCFLLLSLQLCF